MKKFIIILLSVIGFSGCLDEGEDGCPGFFRLRFLLEGPTRTDIPAGNDLLLYQFHNGIFYADRLVSYEEIENGNEYKLRKEYDGPTQFVAVTHRRDEAAGTRALEGNGSADSYVLELKVDESGQYLPMKDVYMGDELAVSGFSENTLVEIEMKRANCNLEVKVYDDTGILTATSSTIEVAGTKSSMGIDFKGMGPDAVIPCALSRMDPDSYTSGLLGLLPSDRQQTIIITLLQDGVPAFRVDTEQRSEPGKDITVAMHLGLTAEISVDGWRVKNVSIEGL